MRHKKTYCYLLIAIWLLTICGNVVAASKNETKTPFVYYKNETWKSRWKWSLLYSGAALSVVTMVYANSQNNYRNAKAEVTLDEDKEVLEGDIRNHGAIMAITGTLAVFSLGSSIYLFVTDDSGIQSAASYIPQISIAPTNIDVSWDLRF